MHTPRPGGQGHMHAWWVEELPERAWTKTYPFSSQLLCTIWLNRKALALLPGFCIAVPLLAACAKTWLPQGLAWLLPWMPKPGGPKIYAWSVCFSVCVHEIYSGWIAEYQPWWADVWLPCFCDAAGQGAGRTAGKQQISSVCISVALD